MKKLVLSLLTLFVALTSTLVSTAQIYDPVDWTWEVEYLKNGDAKLVFTASVEDHWHIYSLDVTGGPLPTEFSFEEHPGITWKGEVAESTPITQFDKSFGVELAFHEDGAQFTRTLSVKEDLVVKGYLSFMVCNDEMCLPPEYVDFEISVKAPVAESKPVVEAVIEEVVTSPAVTNEDPVVEETTDDSSDEEATITETEETEDITPADEVSIDNGIGEKEGEDEEADSKWVVFLKGFGGGLAALFMPCIFPMIPLTVSFFTKQSKTKSEGIRKAIFYGVSINAIYVSLGMIITIIFGSDALNALSTNPYFNFAFFILFVVFAISFFGAFEITLPSKWVNKADEASNKGGMLGIFFMAFTLSLVSFSCTGPIIGTLLVDASQNGEVFGPAVGMFGFALALSLPFMLFAAFPGWMNSLPKSGGWLNTVKVTLGFLELAFAMKFFSTADLVLQLHWLEREMFIAIWVGISFALTLYLFGVYRLPHDSPSDRIGVGRMLTGLVFLCFGFYMIPGVFGAPVKIIAGFPPPAHYAEMEGGAFSGGGGGHAITGVAKDNSVDVVWGEHCPLGMNCFNDIEEGLEYAKHVNKPILLDFTGWGCVNCRKMEDEVWVDPSVMQRLQENFVLVSLYVDEFANLPEDEQYVSEFSGKKVTRVGQKWSDFQASTYGTNSQPYYVIIDHESYEPLNGSAAYDRDIEKFRNWLDEGQAAFEK